MSAAREIVKIAPQEGPQTDFLTTTADIALYGGAAGGGKSFALLLEPLRHFTNGLFGAVIFRRNSTQIRNLGGLWDESIKLYTTLGAHPREAFLDWKFPSGMVVKFGHIEHEKNVHDWHGSQIALIGFDELTQFTRRMFFYMLSRNRSASGVPGYIRATCNPDADSWVRELITWWIDDEGYPIKERSGVLRWFIVQDDEMIWGDSGEELIGKYGAECLPKSFTFIPSNIQDNKILLRKDPAYLANLRALSRVDRLRLEGGNWNIRATAGEMFLREWFRTVDAIPQGWSDVIRFWDRAATKPSPEKPDPDWTRGLLLYKYKNNTFLVADLRSMRDTPGKVETYVLNTASFDGKHVRVMSQQDPGSAGVSEAERFTQMLSGYIVKTETMDRDKVTRAKSVSAQAEAGNISILRAPWNKAFFDELENFPEGAHDDIVDVLSGAFNELSGSRSFAGVV